MLRAFIDDSGSDDTKYFIMAGYVGGVSSWQSFDSLWRGVLEDSPAVPYFHAAEAQSLRSDGVWHGVTEHQRDAKIGRLVDVIRSVDIQAAYVRLKQSDYNEIFKGRVPEKWDSPFYCLFSSFVSLCGTQSAPAFDTQDPIEFMFDDHQRYRKHGQEFYEGSRVLIAKQTTPNVHFGNDKDYPALQAADLLAWEVRRAFCYPNEERLHFDRLRGGGVRPHLAWTVSSDLLWSWRTKFERLCSDVLADTAKSCGIELVGDLRPWVAKNPDPNDKAGHELFKQLHRAAKDLARKTKRGDNANHNL